MKAESISIPSVVAAQFLSSGLVALLIWWMEEIQPFSATEMNRMFMTMASDGLRSNKSWVDIL
jgi:hypothetical protein